MQSWPHSIPQIKWKNKINLANKHSCHQNLALKLFSYFKFSQIFSERSIKYSCIICSSWLLLLHWDLRPSSCGRQGKIRQSPDCYHSTRQSEVFPVLVLYVRRSCGPPQCVHELRQWSWPASIYKARDTGSEMDSSQHYTLSKSTIPST